MLAAGSMAMPTAPNPAWTVAGVWPQPVCLVPLQVAPLITDTVPGWSPSAVVAVVTVSVAWSTAMPQGLNPALTVAGAWRQPVCLVPLQVAPLNTYTRRPPNGTVLATTL